MDKVETKLNLEYYSGKDAYSDGKIEDELLEIVKNKSETEFDSVIYEKKSWPVLYHLSNTRESIVNWLESNKHLEVLEIGSGCGAVTGALARKFKHVSCIDLSKKRSLINLYKNQKYSNISITVGNYEDIESHLNKKFDLITLIGVFEYSGVYLTSKNPYKDMLEKAKRHLAPNGRLIIAIENKFGLKYWAGCKEDHVGKCFEGLEGYPSSDGVRTFTKLELESLFKEVGFAEYKFYYPYPDYKFATDIYSDEFLPKKDELDNNSRNFDQDRVTLFDEKKVFNSIIESQLFPLFSNSYLIVLEEKKNG